MLLHKNKILTRVLSNVLSFSLITSNLITTNVIAAPNSNTHPSPPNQPGAAPQDPEQPQKRLIIKMRDDANDSDADNAIASVGGKKHSAIRRLHMHVVTVPQNRAATVLNLLKQDARIASVELDQTRHINATPDDPAYNTQWALPKIAWDQVFNQVSIPGTATLAILDTGVQSSDVAMVAGWSAFGSDPSQDPNGHGTSLASIAAATTNNNIGIAGVAYSGVSIMPVQVIGADGTGQDSDIVSGVTWAVDNGANVILMAFSDAGTSTALQDAVNYAWNHGVVVVAAAGNDGSTSPTYPAGDANVVGVGATDQNDAMWSGSNISQSVFLTAPGVEIAAETAGGTLVSITGTSASAAIVAAAAALLKAHDTNATPGMIVNRLAINADPVGMANGRLNLARALVDTSTTEIAPVGAQGGGPLVGPYTIAANRKITVTIAGNSKGSVTSSPAGINCPSNQCFSNFNTTQSATLTATPNAGSVFTGWSGACSGTSTCLLPASSSDQAVTANFKYTSSVTVTCSPSSVVYNGSAQTPCSATYTTTQPASGSLAVTYASNTAAGTATASASYAGDAQNVSSNGSTTFAITQKPLTVSFTTSDKTYDGTTTASVGTCSLTGVLSGDTNVNCVTTGASANFSDKNASISPKTVTGTGFSLGGSNAANYVIQTINSPLAKINAKQLGLSFSAANKIYDGTTAASITGGCNISGVISPDVVNCVSTGATATFADKNVQNGKTVTGSGFSLSGAGASNYSLPANATTTANITGVALAVSLTIADKTYDGTTAAVITGCTLPQKAPGDNVDCVFSGASATFADKNVSSNKNVTVTGLTLSGSDSGNYSINLINQGTAGIAKRALTISATGNNKSYDATTTATVSLSDDRVAGDSLTTSYASASFASASAGTNKAVSVNGISLSGSDAGNYTYNTTATTTANIAKLMLTVTADDKTRAYGSENPAFSATITGFLPSETLATSDVTGAPSCTSTATASSSVGSYAISCAQGALSSTNYTFTFAPGNLSITPALLTITPDAISETAADDHFFRVYGQANPATYTLRYDGFVGTDNASVLTGSPIFSTAATQTSGVGLYPVTVTGLSSSNYMIHFNPGVLEITKATLLVNAVDASKIYGEAEPTFTWTYSGFANGETSVAVSGTASCSRVAGESVGDYTITCAPGSLISTNYSFAVGSNATMTIKPASLTVTADDQSRLYGSANPVLTETISGFILGENLLISDVVGVPSCTTTATAASTVLGSPYAIHCSIGSLTSHNYTFTFVDGRLNVLPAPLTITPDAIPTTPTDDHFFKTYGQPNPTSYALRYDGFVNNENESVLSGTPILSTSATETSAAATYPVTVEGFSSSNYAIKFNPGTLEIQKATLSVNAVAASKTYGDQDPTLTWTYSGFANAETSVNITGGSVVCSRTAGESAGNYTVTCVPTGLASDNYNFVTGATSSFTINQAVLSVNAVAASKTYGSADPAFTWTYSGFVGSDIMVLPVGNPSCSRTPGNDVGTYQITCASGTLSTDNYTFVTGSSATFTINQAVLMVNELGDKTKTYGSADPVLTWDLAGFMYNENAASAGISGSAACSREQGENVGNYVITCLLGTLQAKNYSFMKGSTGILKINQATLAVNASNASKNAGAADPAFTWSYTGFVNSDTPSSAGISGNASCSRAPGESYGTYAITCAAGNLSSLNYAFTTGTPAVMTINDVTAPTITISAPANNAVYVLNQSVTASYQCQDEAGGSAIASCGGTPANGSLLSTNTLGSHNYAVTAKDKAGNSTTKTYTYNVQYKFAGFGSPVNMAAVNVANAGRAIPLVFSVTDALGNGVTNLPQFAIYQVQYQCGNTDNFLTQPIEAYATGASGLQNLGGGNYQFNWNTAKNFAGSCRQIQVNAGDGVIHVADFKFQ